MVIELHIFWFDNSGQNQILTYFNVLQVLIAFSVSPTFALKFHYITKILTIVVIIFSAHKNVGEIDSETFSGRQITQKIMGMDDFKSISGNSVRWDTNADPEGTFAVFSIKPYNYTFSSRITKTIKFTCKSYPVKVNEPKIESIVFLQQKGRFLD